MGAIQGSKESKIMVICFTGRIVDCWPGRISSSIFRLERCGAVGSRRTLDERAKWDTPSRVPERLRSQEGAGPTKPEVWVHETGEPLDQAGTVTGQTVDRQTLPVHFNPGYHRRSTSRPDDSFFGKRGLARNKSFRAVAAAIIDIHTHSHPYALTFTNTDVHLSRPERRAIWDQPLLLVEWSPRRSP